MKRAVALCCAALALAGCERAMQDMYEQPRYRGMQDAPSLSGRSAVQPLPAKSVERASGELASTSSGRLGEAAAVLSQRAQHAGSIPYPVDYALLERGRDRFSIYCAPCHGLAGDGDGLVARRGFPHPPSYHIERLRRASDRHFYDVMSDGYGIMYSYADRVAPQERWAIVAYIRALQLSQQIEAARLPPEIRARLDALTPDERR
jgi:mono/diheme cytochrome c family protein